VSNPFIDVRDLRVAYDGHEVLHGIDLSIGEGEFVSIVGRSGCGKSTLLLALAGFIARQGDVRFPPDFGIVLQNYAVFPWMTVRDNVGFGLGAVPSRQRREVVDRYLALVGLGGLSDRYPSQLSGGQIQRVALARALAPEPKVILLDEPFGALDTFTRAVMQQWLADLWQRSPRTALFVSHNIEEALVLSDRIVLMDGGTIAGQLSVDFARPRSADIAYTPAFVELRRAIVDRIGRVPTVPFESSRDGRSPWADRPAPSQRA
jgi:ABC-type nitrate/sulfonate/bicarbonate transport system ATPase subunit